MHYWDAVASAGPCSKKPVRHPRQITTRTPHHLLFTGRMLFLMPNQLCQALKAGSFNVHTKASRSQCNSTMWNRNLNRKVKRHKIKNTDLLGSNHSYLECLESFLGEKSLWWEGFVKRWVWARIERRTYGSWQWWIDEEADRIQTDWHKVVSERHSEA